MTQCKSFCFLLAAWMLLVVQLYADTTTLQQQYIPSETLAIPMRDGTLLPTDIYLPDDLSQKYPVILIRNPSGRYSLPWITFADLRHAGFIVAFQDTRSALDTEGKTMPYYADGWGEQKDGYDAVEALAKYKYSNGKVGTAGYSAPGITQLMLAPSAPPSLCAQHIGVAASNLYEHAIYPGGCLQKNQVEGWLKMYAKDPSMMVILKEEPCYNAFWQNFNTLDVSHQVEVPALLYGGWYDTFLQGTLDAFSSRQEKGAEGAKGTQKLVIGPWTHTWPRNMRLGEFDIPAAGKNPPWDISPLAWFDHYLKGKSSHLEKIPPVTYYVMGPFDGSPSKGNVWKSAQHWPIPSHPTPFFLTDGGMLIPNKRPNTLFKQTYPIDPENPTPTLGGPNLFLEAGPKDQRTIEERKDVLVFTTEPLAEDTEITGRLLANIYFLPPAHHADIVVRLTDVYPDGKSILINDGAYHFTPTQPGVCTNKTTPKLAEIDLWSTSIVIAKGHRIRVSVSGSNYPRYEKTQLPSKHAIGARQNYSLTFLTGGDYASHITLPIVD